MATYTFNNFNNSSDTQSESSFKSSSSDTQLDTTETESYPSDTDMSDFELPKRQYGLDTDNNEEQLSDSKSGNDDKLKELMKIDYTYPELDDVNFQEKMFKKREFYYHRIQQRDKMDNYNDVKTYKRLHVKDNLNYYHNKHSLEIS